MTRANHPEKAAQVVALDLRDPCRADANDLRLDASGNIDDGFFDIFKPTQHGRDFVHGRGQHGNRFAEMAYEQNPAKGCAALSAVQQGDRFVYAQEGQRRSNRLGHLVRIGHALFMTDDYLCHSYSPQRSGRIARFKPLPYPMEPACEPVSRLDCSVPCRSRVPGLRCPRIRHRHDGAPD